MRGMRIIAVAAILIVIGAGVWVQRSRGPAQSAADTMRTARVTRGTLTASVTASGALQPYAQVEVRSRATGTVMDVRVQEGDRVTKDQLLAIIDDSDARAGYETGLAQLAAAQAGLAQATLQLRSTRAQNVAAVTQAEDALRTSQARLAQVLAGSRPQEIDQAQAALQQAQSAAELARVKLERTGTLYGQGLVARQDVDQAQNEHDVALAQVRSAQSRLAQLQAGSAAADVAVVRAQVREAESALAAARARRTQEAVLVSSVTSAEASVRINRANLAQTAQRLGESRVAAPIDGVVAGLAVQVGQTVIGGSSAGGTLLMTLTDTRVMQAHIAVDESDIAQVRVGMPVRLTVDALPDQVFSGTVTRIAPQSTVTQNVTQFTVIVTVQKPDQSLRLGMSVDGEFIVVERRDVLLVPSEAVRGSETRIVQLVQGEMLVPTTVETGATDGRRIEITTGLQEGQVVYLGQVGGTSSRSSSQTPVNPFMPQPPGGR